MGDNKWKCNYKKRIIAMVLTFAHHTILFIDLLNFFPSIYDPA